MGKRESRRDLIEPLFLERCRREVEFVPRLLNVLPKSLRRIRRNRRLRSPIESRDRNFSRSQSSPTANESNRVPTNGGLDNETEGVRKGVNSQCRRVRDSARRGLRV